uniref:Hypothetical chloroplast RF15 n=1 Tax=Gentiana apiata TaxID=2709848 RepID=A0A7T8V5P9_9GENT|nr:hypothetical chloroplast RF15 [Gentiana apiata]QQQ88016.1 hypothetical chloroplast RF15 [Gentiana apiata]
MDSCNGRRISHSLAGKICGHERRIKWMGGRVVETPASSIFLTLAPLKSWIKTDGMNCLNKNY